MKFIYPTNTRRVTSKFRTKERPNHHGIDIAEGGIQSIYAVANGVVTKSYTSSTYGECIMILHNVDGQEFESVYAHMKAPSRTVGVGNKVLQGQILGLMGNTGDSHGQHLHFELHRGRWNINKTNAVDPLKYIGVSPVVPKKEAAKKHTSLVDYLKANHMNSDFYSRRALATKHGISSYTGTYEQNVKLLSILQG